MLRHGTHKFFQAGLDTPPKSPGSLYNRIVLFSLTRVLRANFLSMPMRGVVCMSRRHL